MSERSELTRWLIANTRGLLRPLVLSVAARIVGQTLGVAMLVIAADALAHHRPVGTTIGWLVGLAVLKAALRYLEHFSGHHVAFGALQRLRELFFERLIPQAPAATTGEAGAELTARATRDIDRIEVFFAHTFPPAVSAVVVPAGAVVWLAFAVDGRLAALVACFALLAFVLPFTRWRAGATAAAQVAARRGVVAARVGDDVQGIGEILALQATGERLAALDDAEADLAHAGRRAATLQAQRQAIVMVVQLWPLVAIAHAGTDPQVGRAAAAVALAVMVGLWVPLRGVEGFVAGLDAAFAAAARVRQVVDAPPLVPDLADAARAAFEPGDLVFDDVTLTFPGHSAPALDHVSATFPAGRWSYVCGVSGGGKSTLLSLLLRDHDPDAGAVRIGGVDLRDQALGLLRSRIAIVDQRPTMLVGTVADNLRLGAPDAAEPRLRAALDVAGLDLALGSRIGERGATVSGGQLQRLALARALVADPDVLILDEALSQLDEATAAGVRERLAARTLTVIESTHRVDLVPPDATVVVLDNGRTVDPVSGLQRLRTRG